MKNKRPTIKILLAVLTILLTSLACSLGSSSSPAQGELEISITAPTTAIDFGRTFSVRLTLSNPSQYNVHVTKIELPADFMSRTKYQGSQPPLSISTLENGQGLIPMDLNIAPTGVEEFVFQFEALSSGTLSGDGQVVTDDKSYPFTLTTLVSGTNPGEWQPGISPETAPADLGPIPYRAVVQIKAVVSIDGELRIGWTGSGTIVSRDGLILTNAHVVLSDRFYEVQDLIVSLTVAQDQPPVDTYYASIVQADAALDIAVIKPRTDMEGNPLNYSLLELPAVALGNSDALQLGDEIVILGYPGIGGETITLTRGEVSGFTSEEAYGNRAFIKTSGTIAGGNSGGLAVNVEGELIGVPTQVGSGDITDDVVDCRPLMDTNRDGYIDQNDSCVPTGGFINALRPIRLAESLIAAARQGEVMVHSGQGSTESFSAEGQLIFEDDFSNSSSGWTADADEYGVRGYENGEYTIQVNEPMYLIWADQEYAYDNLVVEVTARVDQAVGDSDFGIICGVQDNDNFTALEISEDGYFIIWKQVGEDVETLIDWTYSDLVAAGGPFQLSAVCGSQKLVLALNDVVLGEVVDPGFRPGSVGVLAGSFDIPGFKAAFDDFRILLP